MRRILLYLTFSFLSLSTLLAQNDENLIQFSGIVVNSDSITPIPFVTIMIKNTYHGTTADYYGYFSFVATKGDTIVFSSVGYQKSEYTIPDTLTGKYYSLIHTMNNDTVQIETVKIYPWPTPSQFKEAFLNLEIPDDQMDIARKNLAAEKLAEYAQEMPMTASMNYKWQVQQRQSQLYYAGQFRPNNLLNPIAWAKFIEAWKRGDFKRK